MTLCAIESGKNGLKGDNLIYQTVNFWTHNAVLFGNGYG